MLKKYKKLFAEILEKKLANILSQEEIEKLIERPPSNIPGDLAFPCFQLAKSLKKSPQQIAQEIAEVCQSEASEFFSSFTAVGPYINAHIEIAGWAREVVREINKNKSDYGRSNKTGQTILVEGRSPNTHKQVHIGHLRNVLVSESTCTIQERAGNSVIRSAYGGDIGAHVAKWLRYFVNFTDKTYPSDAEAFCKRSGKLYEQATTKVAENKEEYKKQIHETQRLLEAGDETLVSLWKETRALSIQGLQNVFEELGSTIERYYRESEVEQPGIDLIKKYVDDESMKEIKMSQGAIIADLEVYNLGVFVLLKSNGTSLYSTKDIALAHLKEEENTFDRSLYVVATEQNHHFKQLFKTLELTGYDTQKLLHMAYELVELPTGKMSSRKGTVIPYHVWRDETINNALEMVKERQIEDKEGLARDVAFAALKFSMLLQDTYKKIIFDSKKSLSFEGETGPYIQYTHARCHAMLQKAGSSTVNIEGLNYDLLQTPEERELIISLALLPMTIQQAAEKLKPSIVARYVLELARSFNSFYGAITIIDSSNKELQDIRIALVAATKQVLANSLHILGIATPEKM